MLGLEPVGCVCEWLRTRASSSSLARSSTSSSRARSFPPTSLTIFRSGVLARRSTSSSLARSSTSLPLTTKPSTRSLYPTCHMKHSPSVQIVASGEVPRAREELSLDIQSKGEVATEETFGNIPIIIIDEVCDKSYEQEGVQGTVEVQGASPLLPGQLERQGSRVQSLGKGILNSQQSQATVVVLGEEQVDVVDRVRTPKHRLEVLEQNGRMEVPGERVPMRSWMTKVFRIVRCSCLGG